jgi:hypothetical protein
MGGLGSEASEAAKSSISATIKSQVFAGFLPETLQRADNSARKV